ncbi:MAG: LysM peptidoglycan-binding domain-containing protein, partial [Chloroflexota bacterium]|nr:LysM peptidoglycan-binding domain-containing protein [Chloroflexota bacterium]
MPQSYTVRSGDTLYAIARKFGVTVAAITAVNNIPNPNLIKTGQVLTIPDAPVPPPAPQPPTPPPAPQPPTPPPAPQPPTPPPAPQPPIPPPAPPPPVSAVPAWYTPLAPATRPAAALPLNQFPRPLNDNGRGIHFALDLGAGTLEKFIPSMVELGIKWALFYAGDEMQAET